MSFADPQSVTVNSVPVTLPRVNQGNNSSTYTSNDGTLSLTVSHAYGKRNRRTISLTQLKTVPDPIVPAQNRVESMRAYLVVDVPKIGIGVADQAFLVSALVAELGEAGKVTQLLGGEN